MAIDSASAMSDYRQSAYEKMRVQPLSAAANKALHHASDSLSAKINARAPSAVFDILDSAHDSKGRRAIARARLMPGTLVVREAPLPAVIRAQFAPTICAACLTAIVDDAKSKRRCRACEHAHYCSMTCLMADIDRHRAQCRALAQLQTVSDSALIDADLVKAVIEYAVKRSQSQSQSCSDTDTAIDPANFSSDWSDVDAMVANLGAVTADDLTHMRDGAKAILTLLPPECHRPVDDLVAFMGRVNNNSHALNANTGAVANGSVSVSAIGFGLFPCCSILNHSCYPNCVFVNEGSRLVMRTIDTVEAGDELTVNYIALYASMATRRCELKLSKQFDCDCRRCTLAPTNDDERRKFEFDQYVSGIKCQRVDEHGKRCDGIYRLMEPVRASDARRRAKQREKAREKKRKAKAKARAQSQSETSTIANNDSELDGDNDSESKPESARPTPSPSMQSPASLSNALDWFPVNDAPPLLCNQCGHALPLERARDIEIEWLARVESALDDFGRTGHENATESFAKLSALNGELSAVFHPSHGYLFAVTLPLINLHAALGMTRDRRELIKQIRARSEQCFPQHFQPLNNYLLAEAASLKSQLTSNANVPKKLAMKMNEERIALLARIKEIARICHGEDSGEYRRVAHTHNEAVSGR